jgi:hypothetical protein
MPAGRNDGEFDTEQSHCDDAYKNFPPALGAWKSGGSHADGNRIVARKNKINHRHLQEGDQTSAGSDVHSGLLTVADGPPGAGIAFPPYFESN